MPDRPAVCEPSTVSVYAGFDRDACRDWTGWYAGWARSVLPAPQISPTCKRKGHLWSEPIHEWPDGTHGVGCIRCAKRGLLVIETRYGGGP